MDSPLNNLGVTVLSQNSLERKVANEADSAIIAKDIEQEKRRLEKALTKLQRFQNKFNSLKQKSQDQRLRISQRETFKKEILKLENGDLKSAQKDVDEIIQRLKEAEKNKKKSTLGYDFENENDAGTQLPDETKHEFLMRTGKITAFGNSAGFVQNITASESNIPTHTNLIQPGFEPRIEEMSNNDEKDNDDDETDDDVQFLKSSKINKSHTENIVITDEDESDFKPDTLSDDEESRVDELLEEDEYVMNISSSKRKRKIKDDIIVKGIDSTIDDGSEAHYKHRLEAWTKARSSLRIKNNPKYIDDPTIPEWEKPHPSIPDALLNDQFKLPGDIFPSLFDYQKTCVQWLYELYSQKTGGIIGDEMGLGKTVQMISFLAGLHHSGMLKGPILVVCPATVLKQWCAEFQKWWPPFRAVILHSIGEAIGSKKQKKEFDYSDDEEIEDEQYDTVKTLGKTTANESVSQLVNKIVQEGHVIITTYAGVKNYARYLLPVKWGYVVLDEGHKIRNPDSYITITCKQLKTPNRIILSGTPIQNNLIELWSLFDFVFPGKLGTLPIFQGQFCIPINLGGYANATNVQVQTGYKCALILKDLISPYLLRRVKADVARDLPKKSEMVLFCKLTKEQRLLYKKFLDSEDAERIKAGKKNALFGIDTLRKICNHPQLMDPGLKNKNYSQTVEILTKTSGKLKVVSSLIPLWCEEKRKILIFCQTRQMLNIIQSLLEALNRENAHQYPFMRMDGTTPVSQRQRLVDTFNTSPDVSVFLLTTRVGGLGVNLTSASRVIIYDPDWNPSTDMQARERAWRLGQKQDVVIYRLMIAGSIEEKIYHRQIFKQFLTNKILKDPKQKRFFKMTDLYDLFSLGDDQVKGTETADLFNTDEVQIQGNKDRKSKFKRSNRISNEDDLNPLKISINGVQSSENYKIEEEKGMFDDDNENNEDKSIDNNADSILSKVLKNSVHSTLSHDSILSSSSLTTQSSNIIDREASRIANQAVAALKQSRKETRRSGINVPTWTGKFGKAGGPLKNKGIGIGVNKSNSSKGILSMINQRTQIPKSASRLSNSVSKSPDPSENQHTKMVGDMIDYLSQNDHFSSSAMILKHLNIKLTDDKSVQIVRSMLKSICTWDKERKGWYLKDEFK